MPRLDRTFTSDDVLRVWAQHLDPLEQFEVARFFFNLFAVTPSEVPGELRDAEARFDNVEAIVGNLVKLIPGAGRALESVVVLLFAVRKGVIELTEIVKQNQDKLFDLTADLEFD